MWFSRKKKDAKRDEALPGDVGATSRRDALRAIGLAGGTVAAASVVSGCPAHGTEQPVDDFSLALDKPWVPGAEKYGTFEQRWIRTSCGQCPANCGIRVRVVEGRAVRIEGNPENPINRGGIGPRGLSALQALYDPDRIRTPLVRKAGKLEPTTWAEAERLLASKLSALRSSGRTDKLLVMSGKQRGFSLELLQRFCQVFGTPNLVDGRPSRTSVMAQAMQATVGHFEIPAYDWQGADYVVSFEAGLLEDSCQAVYFARAAAEARRGKRGHRAKLVHAGPTFDLSAHNADEWIQINPGTSGTLALGLCHVLLRDERFDRAAVEARTTGIELLRERVAELTPARVEAITGAPAEAVVRIARELEESLAGAFGFVDERSLSYSNSWETALSVLDLNALLGAVGRPSAGLMVEPRAPYADWPALELDEVARAGLARPRLDRAGTPDFPLARSIHETLPEAITQSPPEVVLLHYANPVYARPSPTRWRDALRKVPFVVSFSPFRDESVEEVAHLVLPDHTFFERWDDAVPAPSTGRAVAPVRHPVVEPLHDTRATGDVILELSRKLGDPVARAMPWRTYRGAVEERLVGLHAAQRGNIVQATERLFLGKLYEEGFWADLETAGPELRYTFQVAHAEPEWFGEAGEYPLRLLVYRPLGYAEGSGANQPWLRFLRSRPDSTYWSTPCTMHPDMAPDGVHDGDEIEIRSEWGTVVAPARLDESMRKGYVAIPEGGGHTAFGRWAQGFGANPLHLVRPGPARRTGAGVLCNTRVRIRAVRRREEG